MIRKEFAKPLIVTSPHMKGKAVRDAQWLLAGHNRFPGLAPYKDGDIDADYGPLTAQATRKAKYWLGYPDAAIDGLFGQTLFEYLREKKWRPLPDDFRQRRDQRLKAAAEANLPGLKAMNYGERFVGYHETWRNRNIFGRWMGFDGVAWCAEYISYCLWHTGWTKMRSAAVYDFRTAGEHGWHGMYVVRSPRRGDLVCYAPDKHIGFFDHWVNSTTFRDLGGNTSDGIGWSNGGEVARTTRRTWQVQRFVRIGG